MESSQPARRSIWFRAIRDGPRPPIKHARADASLETDRCLGAEAHRILQKEGRPAVEESYDTVFAVPECSQMKRGVIALGG